MPRSELLILDTMDRRQALEAGLRAELEAPKLYEGLIAATGDPVARETYRELCGFEDSHLRTPKSKIAAIGDSSAANAKQE